MTDALRTAFGRVDVTPAQPVPLFGFADRLEPYSRVAGRIELNGGVLRWRDRMAILLTGDFLYMSNELINRLVAKFGARFGFGPAEVLLGASHTHFAPAIDPTKPGLGVSDPAYLDFLTAEALALIGGLLDAAGQPVEIRHGSITSRHNCDRRNVQMNGDETLILNSVMSDPGSLCDETLDVIRFDDAGAPVGAILRYACHPVAFHDKRALSAEFPGVIRQTLRATTGQPYLPILFLQGCAGNMVPIHPARRDLGSTLPSEHFQPVQRQPTMSVAEWEQWTASLAANANAAFEAAGRAVPSAPCLNTHRRDVALPRLIDGLSGDHQHWVLSTQVIELSADLLLLALSAEPTSAWRDILSDLAPGRIVLPIGYAGQVYGYLPTARDLTRGGYEAGRFLATFGIDGQFRPDHEEVVVQELEAMLAPLFTSDVAALRRRLADRRTEIDHLRSERELARALYLLGNSAKLATEQDASARSTEFEQELIGFREKLRDLETAEVSRQTAVASRNGSFRRFKAALSRLIR